MMDFEEMLDIMKRAKFCRLGTAQNNHPYVVPMHFKLENSSSPIRYVLQSDVFGEKMSYMHHNPNVSLELEEISEQYMSTIIIKGKVTSYRNIESNQIENCVLIDIVAYTITGRKYVCHGITAQESFEQLEG